MFTRLIGKVPRPGKGHPYFSTGRLAQCLGGRRYCSPSDMKFRIYPRRFPFAMLNVMNYGRKFLKVLEEEDTDYSNCVLIDSNGLIDPYLEDNEEGS